MVGVLFKIPGGASFLCCISPSRLTLNGILSVEYNVLFNKRYFVACAASIKHGCSTSWTMWRRTKLHSIDIRKRSGRLNESDSLSNSPAYHDFSYAE